MDSFFYSRSLLLFLLDYYFSGGMVGDFNKHIIKIGKINWGFEKMSAMKSDIARAVDMLDIDEKTVTALRHAGHTFYEITRVMHISKSSAIDIYQGAIVRMMVYLNGPVD